MLQKNILVFLLGLTVACARRFILFGQFKHDQDAIMATTKEHQPASVTKENTLDGKSSFLYNKLLAFGKNKALISSDMKKNISRTDQRSNSSETPLSGHLNSFLHDIHPNILDYDINNSSSKENHAYSIEVPKKIVSGNYSLFNRNIVNSTTSFIWNSHTTSENMKIQDARTRNLTCFLVVTNLQLFFTFYPVLLKQFNCNSYTSIDRNSELDICIEKVFSAYSKYKELLLYTQSKILILASEFKPKKNRLIDKENFVMSKLNNTTASIIAKKSLIYFTVSAKKQKYLKIAEQCSEQKNEPLLDFPQDKVRPHEEQYIKTTLQSKKKYSLSKKEKLSSNLIFFQNMFRLIHSSGIKTHNSPRLSQNGILGPQTTNIGELRDPWKRETAKSMSIYKKVKPILHNDNKRILVSHTVNSNHVKDSVEDQRSEFNKEFSRDENKRNALSVDTLIFLKNERQSDIPIFKGKSQLLEIIAKVMIQIGECKNKSFPNLINSKKKKHLPKRIDQDFQRKSTLCTLNQCIPSKLSSSTVFSANKGTRSSQPRRISQKLHILKTTLKLDEQDNSRNIVLEKNATVFEHGLLFKKKFTYVRKEGRITQRLAYALFDELYSRFANNIKNPYLYDNINRNILVMIEPPAITETVKKMPWNGHLQMFYWSPFLSPRKSVPCNLDDAILTNYPKYDKKNLQIIPPKCAINKWLANIHTARSLKLAKKRKMSSAESVSLMPEKNIFKAMKTKKRRIKRELGNDAKQIDYVKKLSRILKEIEPYVLTQHSDARGTDNTGRKFSSFQNTQKLFHSEKSSNSKNPAIKQNSKTERKSLISHTQKLFPTNKPSNGENPAMKQNSKTKKKSLVPYNAANDNYLENKALDIKNDRHTTADVMQNTGVSFPSKKQNKAEITWKEESKGDDINMDFFEPHYSENKAEDLKSDSLFTKKNAHHNTSYTVSNIEKFFFTQGQMNLKNHLQNGNSKPNKKSSEPHQRTKNKNLKTGSKYNGHQILENIGAAVEMMNDPLIKRQEKRRDPRRGHSILQSKNKKIRANVFDPQYKTKVDKYSKPDVMDILQNIPDFKRKKSSINVDVVMVPKGFLTSLTRGLTANATIFGIIFFVFMVAVSFLLYRESKLCGILEQMIMEKIGSKPDSTEELHPSPSYNPQPEYYHADKSEDINNGEHEDPVSCRRPTLCKDQALGKCNNEAPSFPARETSDSQPSESPHVTTYLDDTMNMTTIPSHINSVQRGNPISCSVEEDCYSKAPSFPTKEVPDSRQFQTPCVTENLNDVCRSLIPEKSSSVQMKIISDSADEEDICNISGNIPLEAKTSSCESLTLNSSGVLNFASIPRFSSPLPNKTLMEVMHDYLSSIDDDINIGKHSNFSN